MTETTRRLLLRVILKLLTLSALFIVAYGLLTGDKQDVSERPNAPRPLHVELQTLQDAVPQRVEWAGGPLQLLRMQANGPLHLFYDRGGSLGCPLVWQPASNREAPLQPWPGGFRDQCSSIWYRYDGQVLLGQSFNQNLQSPPYRLLGANLLQIGVNGDNAVPATPAAH